MLMPVVKITQRPKAMQFNRNLDFISFLEQLRNTKSVLSLELKINRFSNCFAHFQAIHTLHKKCLAQGTAC